jgi:hypothetical protein
MDKFVHRENLALFRRRLDNPALTDAQRKTILRLLTEEQAKGTTAKLNILLAKTGVQKSIRLVFRHRNSP